MKKEKKMQENTESTENTEATLTLADAWSTWLESLHPNGSGVKNRDRKANDLNNFERALACFAAGAGDGETRWDKLPLSLLGVSEKLLVRQLREGAFILTGQANRRPPSDKTVSNLVSGIKAIRKVAIAGQGKTSIRELLRQKAKPKRRTRPPFPKSAWPEALKQEWEGYKSWKQAPFLPPHEDRYRKGRSRDSSFSSYLRRINLLVGYLVREEGCHTLSLEQLVEPERYIRFMNHYLSSGEGGYATAKDVGITLANLSQYLVAKGRIEEHYGGKPIWNVLYEQGAQAMTLGASQGNGKSKAADVGDWKPWHPLELAEEAWESEPVHASTHHGQHHRRQLVSHKRSALFFRLSVETPLRIRNFAEMRWGKNLYRNPRGLWTVRFEGEALKVSHRGFETNVYERAYSPQASAWIDRYCAFLLDILKEQGRETAELEGRFPTFPPGRAGLQGSRHRQPAQSHQRHGVPAQEQALSPPSGAAHRRLAHRERGGAARPQAGRGAPGRHRRGGNEHLLPPQHR